MNTIFWTGRPEKWITFARSTRRIELGKDFSHLRTVYDNLYWSCPTCNLNKGNRWPTDAQYAAGERFLDPCLEDHDAHWETHPDGTISATTPTGRYTIRNIRLDRPRLNNRRVAFLKDQQKLAQILQQMEQAAITPEHRQTLLERLEDVRERLNPSVWVAINPAPSRLSAG